MALLVFLCLALNMFFKMNSYFCVYQYSCFFGKRYYIVLIYCSLSFHLLMNIWIVSRFWLYEQSLCEHSYTEYWIVCFHFHVFKGNYGSVISFDVSVRYMLFDFQIFGYFYAIILLPICSLILLWSKNVLCLTLVFLNLSVFVL